MQNLLAEIERLQTFHMHITQMQMTYYLYMCIGKRQIPDPGQPIIIT